METPTRQGFEKIPRFKITMPNQSTQCAEVKIIDCRRGSKQECASPVARVASRRAASKNAWLHFDVAVTVFRPPTPMNKGPVRHLFSPSGCEVKLSQY